eukprot:CFRG0634T1
MSDDDGGGSPGGGGDFDDYDQEETFEDEQAIDEHDDEQVEFLPAADVTDSGANKEKVTTQYLTKYERARVLGARALQISMNAPVMVELQGESDPLQIAMKELAEKQIPIIIRRYLPDGSFEDWSVNDLIQP